MVSGVSLCTRNQRAHVTQPWPCKIHKMCAFRLSKLPVLPKSPTILSMKASMYFRVDKIYILRGKSRNETRGLWEQTKILSWKHISGSSCHFLPHYFLKLAINIRSADITGRELQCFQKSVASLAFSWNYILSQILFVHPSKKDLIPNKSIDKLSVDFWQSRKMKHFNKANRGIN